MTKRLNNNEDYSEGMELVEGTELMEGMELVESTELVKRAWKFAKYL